MLDEEVPGPPRPETVHVAPFPKLLNSPERLMALEVWSRKTLGLPTKPTCKHGN